MQDFFCVRNHPFPSRETAALDRAVIDKYIRAPKQDSLLRIFAARKPAKSFFVSELYHITFQF